MLVQCPSCRTTYKVSDDVFSGDAPAFRCSRCKHTFELEGEDHPKEAAPAVIPGECEAARSSAEDEPSLPFAPNAAMTPIRSEPAETRHQLNSSSETVTPASEDRSHSASSSEDKSFVFPDATEESNQSGRREDFQDEDLLFRKLEFDDPNENPGNITAISPYLEQRASIKPFVTLFGLLVIGFCLFTAVSHARPETPVSLMKNIPLIGATVLRNNHLKQGILIKSLSTASETIQGNREVLLVTGVALNQNPVIVRELQLTGTIYNGLGKEIERQTIWAGNTLSPKIIRGMTIEDIPQLQELKPLKSFEIPPGDSVPFTIVFLKSAKNAKEFSCEVTAANGEI